MGPAQIAVAVVSMWLPPAIEIDFRTLLGPCRMWFTIERASAEPVDLLPIGLGVAGNAMDARLLFEIAAGREWRMRAEGGVVILFGDGESPVTRVTVKSSTGAKPEIHWVPRR